MDKRILTWPKIILRLIVIIIFVGFATWLVLWILGIKYNPDQKKWEQTSVIAVKNSINDVDVTLNGEKITDKLPFTKRYLSAGKYTLVIKKDGFNDWQKQYDLSPGEAGVEGEVILIAKSPLQSVLIDTGKYNDYVPFDPGIKTDGGAMYDNDALITRFLETPEQFKRINDAYIYQAKDEIRIIFPSRNQDYLVYKLPSEKIAPIFITATWDIVLNLGDGKILKLRLNSPT